MSRRTVIWRAMCTKCIFPKAPSFSTGTHASVCVTGKADQRKRVCCVWIPWNFCVASCSMFCHRASARCATTACITTPDARRSGCFRPPCRWRWDASLPSLQPFTSPRPSYAPSVSRSWRSKSATPALSAAFSRSHSLGGLPHEPTTYRVRTQPVSARNAPCAAQYPCVYYTKIVFPQSCRSPRKTTTSRPLPRIQHPPATCPAVSMPATPHDVLRVKVENT